MRAAFIYFLAVGIFVAGGYAGLFWLVNMSTTVGDRASRPQPAANEAQDKHRRLYPAPEARPEAPAQQQVTTDLQTVGSARSHQAFSPSTGFEVDPTPGARVKAATDGSRMIGENGNRLGKVQLSSGTRNGRHSHGRFARLLKDPLALNCITCLMFDR
jgi:hypothetical protein